MVISVTLVQLAAQSVTPLVNVVLVSQDMNSLKMLVENPQLSHAMHYQQLMIPV